MPQPTGAEPPPAASGRREATGRELPGQRRAQHDQDAQELRERLSVHYLPSVASMQQQRTRAHALLQAGVEASIEQESCNRPCGSSELHVVQQRELLIIGVSGRQIIEVPVKQCSQCLSTLSISPLQLGCVPATLRDWDLVAAQREDHKWRWLDASLMDMTYLKVRCLLCIEPLACLDLLSAQYLVNGVWGLGFRV